MSPAVLDEILGSVLAARDPNLLVGVRTHDDAAVYRLPSGETVVQTALGGLRVRAAGARCRGGVETHVRIGIGGGLG